MKNVLEKLNLTCSAFLLLALTLVGQNVFADEEHSGTRPEGEWIRQTETSYVDRIVPIFKKDCFNCHSKNVNYPWYYKIPGIKQLIQHDIEEAREHLLMSDRTPFSDSSNPSHDLEEIREVVEEGSMPPWVYRIAHWGSVLEGEEKEAVLAWVNDALEKVK